MIRRRRAAIVAFVLCLVAPALQQPVAARAAGLGHLTGTVTSSVDGQPEARVSVLVYEATGRYVQRQIKTAADGSWTAGVDADTDYLVCFRPTYARPAPPAGFLAQCYDGVAWHGAQASRQATPVSVAADQTLTGIDASLAPAAGISGVIEGAGGNDPLDYVRVRVYSTVGRIERTGRSYDGSYMIRRLRPGRKRVCFDAREAQGTASGGYESQCYDGVAWPGLHRLPAGVTPINAPAGRVTTGIDVTLTPSASIIGTVTARSDGAPLAAVVAILYSGTTFLGSKTSNAAGKYSFGRLHAGTPYLVCFDTRRTASATYPAGVAPACIGAPVWTGVVPPPDATPVIPPDGPGAAVADIALGPGGALAGRARDPDTGQGLDQVPVAVFTPDGEFAGATNGTANGVYRINGLAPGEYLVCILGGNSDGPAPFGHVGECHGGTYYNGVDVTGSTITVSANAVTAANFAPARAGAISGRLADPAGTAVDLARIDVFDQAGGLIRSSLGFGFHGAYFLWGLPSSTMGYTVCFDPSRTRPDLLPQCFSQQPWDGDPAAPPTGTTLVPVTADQKTTGVNATFAPAA